MPLPARLQIHLGSPPSISNMLQNLAGARAALRIVGSKRLPKQHRRFATTPEQPSGSAPSKDSPAPFSISFPENPFSAPAPNTTYSPHDAAYKLRSPFGSTPFRQDDFPIAEEAPSPDPQPEVLSSTAAGPQPVRSLILRFHHFHFS